MAGKIFIVIGIAMTIIGILFIKFPGLAGSLPGDIVVSKKNLTFYFPITTSILLSIILTIIISLLTKFF